MGSLIAGLADSARSPYKTARLGWGRFCVVRGISVWLVPGTPGLGEPLLDCIIWQSKGMGRKSPTSKRRLGAVRFAQLINGNVAFRTQAHRGKALIKGLKKREGVIRQQPFNTGLLRWMRKELVGKSAQRSNCSCSMYFELRAACITEAFPYSESRKLRLSGGSIFLSIRRMGGGYLSIRIRHSKTDIFKDGIHRSLIEIDSVLSIDNIPRMGGNVF